MREPLPVNYLERKHRTLSRGRSVVFAWLLLCASAPFAHGSPFWSLGDLQRRDCNRAYAAAAAYFAMTNTNFSSAPYVDPNFQYVVAVNGDTKVVVTVVPIDQTNFWFDVFATSPTDGNAAAHWRDAIRAEIPLITFFDCTGSPGIPVGQNFPPEGTIALTAAQQWKSMPDHCGGFNWCSLVARDAIRSAGLTTSPVIQNPFLITGNNADTSVAVQCVGFGSSWALISVFASSMSNAAPIWANAISDLIRRSGCL
jgi:hypothetical protein